MSNYIVEAFKAMNLLESEDISLNADGVDTLSGFMAEAGVDPDEEEVDVFDIEASEEDELKQSYVGKVVLECSVCHSNIFVDKSEVSVGTDEEGLACYDIECPYCMSNEGYEIIGEVAPFNAEESEELINPEDEEEIPAVDVEGAVDDVDEEDLEESLKKKSVKESWEHEFEAEYDSIQNDPSLTDEQKKEYLKQLFAEFSVNEELKLDGVKELYDNDEIRGVDDLEGVDKLEGVKELHGEKHEAPINESLDDVIEYEADFDPNLGTLEEYKEVLKSYGLKFIKLSDHNGWNPYVEFEGSKKNIIAFLTSDFYGETEESLREEAPELFESIKSKKNKKSLKENIEDFLRDEDKLRAFIKKNKNCIDYDSSDSYLDKKIDNMNLQELQNLAYEVESELNESLKESIEDVSVSTEDETMTMTTKEDGGVVIETSPKEEFIDEMPIEGGDEMIVPLEDESVDEIEAAADANSVEDGEDNIDFEEIAEEEPAEEFGDLEDFEDFDEESFNGLGESYLRSCYENVNSFKTTGASVDGKKLIIEGMIKFDSGNIKETEFVFESIGKGKFEGYNKQISRGKKTYRLNTSVKNNKLVCEALNYNYRSRNELNESVRVYGTVKRK